MVVHDTYYNAWDRWVLFQIGLDLRKKSRKNLGVDGHTLVGPLSPRVQYTIIAYMYLDIFCRQLRIYLVIIAAVIDTTVLLGSSVTYSRPRTQEVCNMNAW